MNPDVIITVCLEENHLICDVSGEDSPETEYAYYLMQGNKRASTQWYTKNNHTEFLLEDSGFYHIVAFLRHPDQKPDVYKSDPVPYSRKYISKADDSNCRINIFGSCVSRDLLEHPSNDFLMLDTYIARQSIVSALSPQVECNPEDFSLDSAFQKRQVLHDFRKDAFVELTRNPVDYLMIDLIDERFNLIAYRNSYVTASNELMASGYFSNELDHNGELGQLIQKREQPPPPRSPVTGQALLFREKKTNFYVADTLLEDYIALFCYYLVQLIPSFKIILHKAYFATHYITKSGAIVPFEKNAYYYNIRMNRMLNYMYTIMERCLPNCIVIDLCSKFSASETHKWGLASMHYQDEYYIAVLEEIKKRIF